MKNNINRTYSQKTCCRIASDLILFFIIFFSLCQCAPSQAPSSYNYNKKNVNNIDNEDIRECKKKRWVGMWWNCYEEGVCFAEKGYFDEAIVSFEDAIREAKKDEWNARTDGINFIDYFPNRELGIIHYYQGKAEYDNAEKENNEQKKKNAIEKMKTAIGELERSLGQTPSAKALFYLELAYKDLPEEEKSSPVITICDCEKLRKGVTEELPNPLPTKDNPMLLCGKVTDKKEKYIRSVYIKSKELGDEPQPLFILNDKDDLERAKEVHFEKQLFFAHGDHSVEISAENIAGKKNELKNLEIQVNRIGRVAVIDKQILDDGKVTVSGFLKNETGVSEFFINGEAIPIQQGKEIHFSKTISAYPKMPVELVAYDDFKNKIYNEYLDGSDVVNNKPILLASAGSSALGNILLAQNGNTALNGQPDDVTPPNIEITNLINGQKVPYRDFSIKARIRANSVNSIKSILLNGENIVEKQQQNLNNGETMISCNPEINLDRQENIIEVIDNYGNRAIKKIKNEDSQVPIIRIEDFPPYGNEVDSDNYIPMNIEVETKELISSIKIDGKPKNMEEEQRHIKTKKIFQNNISFCQEHSIEVIDAKQNQTTLCVKSLPSANNRCKPFLEIDSKPTIKSDQLKSNQSIKKSIDVTIEDESKIKTIMFFDGKVTSNIKSENRKQVKTKVSLQNSKDNNHIMVEDEQGNKSTVFIEVKDNTIKKITYKTEDVINYSQVAHPAFRNGRKKLSFFIPTFVKETATDEYQGDFQEKLTNNLNSIILDPIKEKVEDNIRFGVFSISNIEESKRDEFKELRENSISQKEDRDYFFINKNNLDQFLNNAERIRSVIDGDIAIKLNRRLEREISIKSWIIDRTKPPMENLSKIVLDTFTAGASDLNPNKPIPIEQILQKLAKKITEKVYMEFPFLIGEVQDIEGAKITVFIEGIKDKKLKTNSNLLSYAEQAQITEAQITGVEKDKQIATARITQLLPRAMAIISAVMNQLVITQLFQIKKGDKVITE